MNWRWTDESDVINAWDHHGVIPVRIKKRDAPVGLPELELFIKGMVDYPVGLYVAWEFSDEAWAHVGVLKKEGEKTIKLIRLKDIIGKILS